MGGTAAAAFPAAGVEQKTGRQIWLSAQERIFYSVSGTWKQRGLRKRGKARKGWVGGRVGADSSFLNPRGGFVRNRGSVRVRSSPTPAAVRNHIGRTQMSDFVRHIWLRLS